MRMFLKAFFIYSVTLCGCQQSDSRKSASVSDYSAQLAEARRNEILRLNHLDYLSDSLISFYCADAPACANGTLVVAEDENYMHIGHLGGTREELVCTLSQVEFQQSIFSRLLVTTVHRDAADVVTSKPQFEIALPVTTGKLANCELIPGTIGMR